MAGVTDIISFEVVGERQFVQQAAPAEEKGCVGIVMVSKALVFSRPRCIVCYL